MLRDELVRQGSFLFRYRSYLPYLMLPAAVLALRGSLVAGTVFDAPWRFACFAIACVGLAIRIYIAGTIPAGTSGRNTTTQVSHAINTRGMYSMVRHPLYFANFVVYLGIVLSTANVWFACFCVCAFWIYYERIMMAEEQFMGAAHDGPYQAWAKRTPAFIPRVTGWSTPELPFSPRAALLREFHSIFQAVAIFALLALAEATTVRALPVLAWAEREPIWPRLFVASLVFYLGTMLIKKKTGWLRVAGR
jgi:protein-S-isoprenylcysteine O-methyltransferase Ste14